MMASGSQRHGRSVTSADDLRRITDPFRQFENTQSRDPRAAPIVAVPSDWSPIDCIATSSKDGR